MHTPRSGLMTPADKTKLVGIEALADVTDTTNVDTAGAVMESDIKDQSFTNLIRNGDFESWSAGISSPPDGWSIFAGSVSRSTTHKLSTYAVNLTGDTNLNGITYPISFLRPDINYIIGFWAKVTGITSNLFAVDEYGTGVDTSGTTITTNQDWTWHTHIINIPTSVPGDLKIRIFTAANVGAEIYLDGLILVEGSVCPAFSPHPTDQIPIVLTTSPTDAGTNGETRWYAIAGAAGARRIYMSNGTDWKYQAIAT